MKTPNRALIGPPGAFTKLVFKFISSLAKSHPALRVKSKDRAHSLAPDMEEDIVLIQYPSASSIEGIRDGWLHPILLVPDPYLTVAEALEEKHLRDALRPITSSAVANVAIGRCPTARFVVEDPAKRTDDTLREVAAALDLNVPEAASAAALKACCPKEEHAASLAAALASLRKTTGLAIEHQQTVSEALVPILHFAFGHVEAPVRWPNSLLLDAGKPGTSAPAVVDVTGAARNILYGPYLHLPPADYDVEIMMRFSDWLSDVPFVLGIYAKQTLAEVRLLPRQAGAYTGSFTISVDDPLEAIEIRLRSEKGAIEGDLSMVGLSFRLRSEQNAIASRRADQSGAA